MSGDKSEEIIKLLNQIYPEAGTLLNYSSRFEFLVAVVLSAQSTDEQVNRVTAGLFRKYRSPEDFANLERGELEGLIKGVGLHRNKAGNLLGLSRMLLDNYRGEVPGDFEELLKLPGVGRKSANVIMSVGFGKPGLGVDTHVHRVANRLGLARAKTAGSMEKALKAIIPMNMWSKTHHLLIFHGRKVCKARKPNCENCVLEKLCEKNL